MNNIIKLNYNQIKIKFLINNYPYILIPKKTLLKGGCIVLINFKRTVLEKFMYNFVGICISYRSNLISSSITLRNLIELYPVEYIFNLYSPLIKITVLTSIRYFSYKKRKYYFLRKKAGPLSKINFNYL